MMYLGPDDPPTDPEPMPPGPIGDPPKEPKPGPGPLPPKPDEPD